MRTESPEEFTSSAARSPSSVSDQAAAAGMWAAKLAGYGVATVAFTFMLLRPKRSGPGRRGSLFLGSGVIVVLVKTLLSVSEGSTSPSAPPSAPVLAAATPNPAPGPAPAAPVQPAAPRKRPAGTAVASAPKPAATAVVGDPAPKKPAAAPAVEAPRPKPATAVAPASAAKPAAVAAKPGSPLGSRYTDKAGGYSVQFPAGWSHKPVQEGNCWVLDASDGQSAAINIGFSKFPAKMSVDEVVPEKVTRGLQKRAGTVVHSTGYATIAGRRCLWHKYTGPVSRLGGSARMTAVLYLLPLQDGRALEVRVAAAPEKFAEMAPRMKQSLDSLKLLTPAAEGASARAR